LSEVVRRYYDETAEREWGRLVSGPYHRLEFIITMHFLGKYLPEKGLILDAGGGPGRYAIELAKKGYQVVLLDLSPKCLEIANREIEKASVKDKFKKIAEGSITDLSEFVDESFDAVLCLGALPHLVESKDRELAASELVRVAKKNAHMFVSVIGLYGVFRTILQRLPYSPLDPSREEIFSQGIHRIKWHERDSIQGLKSFPDAYFFHPNELRGLLESRGVETLEMVTCEGLSSHLQEETNKIYEDGEKWERWLEILLRTCTDPSISGIGEHLLYVGRKK